MSTAKPSSPKNRFEEVRALVDQASSGARSATDLMTRITQLLHEKLLKYNWVGFYMMEKKHGEEPVLVLGPFQGAMTPHTRIPLHQGICGAAASTGKTVVVDDVKSDSRYLACSMETKSEIVVPVFVRGEVVGELDIDSHFHAAFGPDDRDFVEHCARVVGWYMEKHKA
jgi:L-methionine (R)-S-oxide reductase